MLYLFKVNLNIFIINFLIEYYYVLINELFNPEKEVLITILSNTYGYIFILYIHIFIIIFKTLYFINLLIKIFLKL